MILNFLKSLMLAQSLINTNGYFRNNGYLFKEKRLCVPKCSIRDLLVREAHERGLMGHFGGSKDL